MMWSYYFVYWYVIVIEYELYYYVRGIMVIYEYGGYIGCENI